MEEIMFFEVVKMVVVGGTFVLLAYSPLPRGLGQAIAHRIMHGRTADPGAALSDSRVDELSGEMTALRQQLYETQERLDFTERMLAQQRERGAIGAGPER